MNIVPDAASAPETPNSGQQALVPAVSRAMKVLSVLLDLPDGATLSEIARTGGLSKSTASNLLRTMVGEQVLSYNAEARRYGFGPLLVELGAVAIGRAVPVLQAKQCMTRLAEATGLACLAIQQMPDGHFLAVDKIESRKDIKVTIGLGERFPADAPLLSRLWNAWGEGGGPSGQRAFTEATITNPQQLLAAQREVRQRGFASVRGEYIPNLNVVGFPVFGADARPVLLVALLGIGEDLSQQHVSALAPELVRAARHTTVAAGGRLPRDFPDSD
jgi:DNA-binding IclR family transcriptional regulator